MIQQTAEPAALGPLLQAFFTEHLISHRLASRQTVDGYRDTFRLLLGFLQRTKGKSPSALYVSDLDAPAVLEFLDYLEKERHNSVRSRNVRLAAIRAFFRLVALRDPASVNLATRVLAIPVKRTDRRLVHYLTRPEIDAVLAAPDRTQRTGQRDYALLLTMYNSGARVSEIASLRRRHIQIGSTPFLEIHGKGRKERSVPIWPKTARTLKTWLNTCAPSPDSPAFPNARGGPLSRDGVNYILKAAARTAAGACLSLSGKRVSPHVIRHTTAMHLLQSGVDIAVIALWLGHESIETTPIVRGTTAQIIHATLVVTHGGLVTVAPRTLAFSAQAGGVAPAVHTVAVGGQAGTPFIAYSNAAWLSVDAPAGTVPAILSIAASTAGLPSGSYEGAISVAADDAIVKVSVSLAIFSASAITAFPASIEFTAPAGSTAQLSQTLSIGGASGEAGISALISEGGAWLSISGVEIASRVVTVSANPGGLAPGSHSGKVIVTVTGGSVSGQAAVPIKLTVGGRGPSLLSVTPAALSFSQAPGGPAPAAQTLTLSGAAGHSFTAVGMSTGAWLTATPVTGSIPGAVTVSVRGAGLAIGKYTGSVSVSVVGRDGADVSVPVTFHVGTSGGQPPPALSVAPVSVLLQYTVGGAIPSQIVHVASGGAALGFSVATGEDWLTFTPSSGSVPASLSISVAPSGLATGTYTGNILVTATNGAAGVLTIPVTLTVSAPSPNVAVLSVSPASLSFQHRIGDPPPKGQSVQVNAPGGTFNFEVASSGWLSVKLAAGVSSGALVVSVAPHDLAAGSHTGLITIFAPESPPVRVEVALTVRPPGSGAIPTLVEPASLNFQYLVGDTLPVSQTITVTSGSEPVMFEVQASSGGWLSATPRSATTLARVKVSVDPRGLAAGVHTGLVILTVEGAQGPVYAIPVTLTVTDGPSFLTVSQTSVSFAARAGDRAPLSETLAVKSTGKRLSFTATAFGGEWLSVAASAGSTPATLTISALPAKSEPGAHSGIIIIEGSGPDPPLTVVVTLTVSLRLATVRAVLNAASRLPGPVAPGAIVEIEGDALGPATAVSSGGQPAPSLGGVRVMFNGYLANLVAAGEDRITAVVPYGIEAPASGWVQVEYGAKKSNSFSVEIREAAPAIFTVEGSGRGAAAALNADSRMNALSTPAAKGSVIALYATGEGRTDPPGDAGVVNSQHAPRPVLPVRVMIGNMPAEVLYAGGVPGSLPGLFQVNARIPEQAPSGLLPVLLTVGEWNSQDGVTVNVK